MRKRKGSLYFQTYIDTVSGETLYVEKINEFDYYHIDPDCDIIHRVDGPAIVGSNGTKYWVQIKVFTIPEILVAAQTYRIFSLVFRGSKKSKFYELYRSRNLKPDSVPGPQKFSNYCGYWILDNRNFGNRVSEPS